jgi:hypothetical protein
MSGSVQLRVLVELTAARAALDHAITVLGRAHGHG